MGNTMSLNISDTLSSFRFSSDPASMPDFASLVGLKDSYADDDPSVNFQEPTMPKGEVQDFFGDEDFDIGGGAGFDDTASMGGYEGDPMDGYGAGGGLGMAAAGESHAPFDPRRQGQGELVMALVGGDDEGMFDYFDQGIGKSWAGAEHWKLRKVSRKGMYATFEAC